MGIRETFFTLFILLFTIFPLFFSITKGKKIIEKSLPDIEILNGKFNDYSPILSQKGNFNTISYFANKDYYLVNNFNLFKKNEKKDVWIKISSKHNAKITKNFLYSKDRVFYFSNEYNSSANSVFYNRKTKLLKGNNFKIFSNKFKGYGDSFVYFDNKINASNVKYILKDNK